MTCASQVQLVNLCLYFNTHAAYAAPVKDASENKKVFDLLNKEREVCCCAAFCVRFLD